MSRSFIIYVVARCAEKYVGRRRGLALLEWHWVSWTRSTIQNAANTGPCPGVVPKAIFTSSAARISILLLDFQKYVVESSRGLSGHRMHYIRGIKILALWIPSMVQ
jgi:hypothetical protein